MRAILQRTSGVEVWIDSKCHARTESGLLVLFGTRTGDQEESCGLLADKTVNLRIFEDAGGKMNLSALDLKAEIMIVSQFTLYADTHKGRRPGFSEAMEPVRAAQLYETFIDRVAASGLTTRSGIFGARMDIRFSNIGPVTIILDHDTD
ncbi:MAG: D-tyrosyl-tRNA(Tyr) deacylase [Candidatus Zixiibacteriota bacterium]|nr:MAG: D-tyrosyl-tRNA(Tyr) deacylase [candidate division Zixibacteria bacterium]